MEHAESDESWGPDDRALVQAAKSVIPCPAHISNSLIYESSILIPGARQGILEVGRCQTAYIAVYRDSGRLHVALLGSAGRVGSSALSQANTQTGLSILSTISLRDGSAVRLESRSESAYLSVLIDGTVHLFGCHDPRNPATVAVRKIDEIHSSTSCAMWEMSMLCQPSGGLPSALLYDVSGCRVLYMTGSGQGSVSEVPALQTRLAPSKASGSPQTVRFVVSESISREFRHDSQVGSVLVRVTAAGFIDAYFVRENLSSESKPVLLVNSVHRTKLGTDLFEFAKYVSSVKSGATENADESSATSQLAISISNDGRLLAASFHDLVFVYHVPTGKLLGTVNDSKDFLLVAQTDPAYPHLHVTSCPETEESDLGRVLSRTPVSRSLVWVDSSTLAFASIVGFRFISVLSSLEVSEIGMTAGILDHVQYDKICSAESGSSFIATALDVPGRIFFFSGKLP